VIKKLATEEGLVETMGIACVKRSTLVICATLVLLNILVLFAKSVSIEEGKKEDHYLIFFFSL
jgi:hypothetical protein